MKLTRIAITAFAAAALSATAEAQRSGDDLVVVTGGVGVEERTALDAERDRYNLRLAFAEKSGQYVAAVRVRLTTADGREVYAGETEGPFMLARLAPGRYRLEAEYQGARQARTLTVGAAQREPFIYLRWPPSS